KAEKAVKEQLEAWKGGSGEVKRIEDEAVEKGVPKYQFFSVLYRQYPGGRPGPKPMKVSNVFAVGGDGKPKLMTEAKEPEEYCKANLGAIKSDEAAKETGRAWLRLSQEFAQDGFFQFTIPDKDLSVMTEKDARKVSGKAVVEPKAGNMGEIAATLTFDDAGK